LYFDKFADSSVVLLLAMFFLVKSQYTYSQ